MEQGRCKKIQIPTWYELYYIICQLMGVDEAKNNVWDGLAFSLFNLTFFRGN